MAKQGKANGSAANLGFEQKLWEAADKMRVHMDAAEYKHVVLGLIFLKYVSDSFIAKHSALEADEWADPEDKDEYLAENVFWVPKEARWSHLKDSAKSPEIGKKVDEAMIALEKENPRLRGILQKDYARASLDKPMLGGLIDLISGIEMGGKEAKARDTLGRVYEYFLSQFANAEGKKGGEFFTPQAVVKTLVEMIEPYKGRIYDPCCGSGGMFVQSEKFIEERGGKLGDLAIYGQESNYTTWKLAQMNLVIRGLDGDLGPHQADTFKNDLHKDLRADYILSNPPFNVSDWWDAKLENDVRWKGYPTPPKGNANYAWMLHNIHHLSDRGTMGLVLANGSMSSNSGGEGEIRQKLVENDLIDCMVALPGQLFYSTQIPVCLWFVAKDKSNSGFRDRRGETLFIDARKIGHMVDRVRRDLDQEDIQKIAETYHRWRGEPEAIKSGGEYADEAGFCKSAKLEEIDGHGFVLTPGRYVGLADEEDDGVPFEEKMGQLTQDLAAQMAEGARLDSEIKKNLEGLGFPLPKPPGATA